MKESVILFDLDGTLIEFPKLFLFEQASSVFSSLGVELPEVHHFEAAFSNFDFFRIAPESLREEFEELYWKQFDWCSYPSPNVFDGVPKLLDGLKADGHRLAIVTSRDESPDEISKQLEGTGVLESIDFIVSRQCKIQTWSDKQPQIREALARFGAEPKKATLVGDVPTDITSAKACNLNKSIALLSGGIHREVLEAEEPSYVLNTVHELERLSL